ncbi:hypothetical protein LQ327_09100 [Actinomycetospora endophytica]|uniref:Uncharacterized protein n=1 Tax=Actinomycetospora endophytica TaxID=2291215 RepID=A0ABS8P941_9PSEU|nr:hypothetical protein [Actinomycetospora endophytica]MCD2193539.1 hypothetical protein [Actinomycetospora endophytica]
MAISYISAVVASSATSTSLGTTTLTTPSFTPNAGDLLVAKIATGDERVTSTSVTDTQGNTWTKRVQSTQTTNNALVAIWTAVASSATSMTVSAVQTNAASSTGFPEGLCVERYSGATVAASPATNTVLIAQGSAIQSTITSTVANSVIVWLDSDWAPAPGTPAYISPASATGTYYQDANGSFYYAQQAAASVGSQTYGMSAPTNQKPALAAMEIIPAAPVRSTSLVLGQAVGRAALF